ncbi:hypothetical protein BKI49_20560 [Streptomyces sp. Tue6028]|uniref:hypothetical protein n=1 Tax=Streptomyces sp. Tue6028 TaxID=2036037 RepID=UPI000BB2D4A2|nr:hypothetical protein [Streptomyces sp. Tue6028]PBC61986.1 hypothetical protein BKI49_20560 [Streptomyces sp. Tue6028]
MRRKAYVPGVAALLAALLAGCTGGSADGGSETDSKGSDTGTAAPARPGKYRTLPEACSAVSHDTLDTLLPGIEQIADEKQREKAYAGEATPTYDTDRRDGCRWKVESTSASDRLLVDFERVASYDNTVSDDNKAREIYAVKETAADLPEPAGSGSASGPTAGSGTGAPGSDASASSTPSAPSSSSSASASAPSGPSASASVTPADLQPRTLDDVGDEAFLDDRLSAAATARARTVTVVFRTSNVIVTIEYAEQPTASTEAPDSKEMQDRAQKLAQKLADTLDG